MFGRRRIAELEQLLTSVQMNSSNNYKDAAKADYETFWKCMAEMKESGNCVVRRFYSCVHRTCNGNAVLQAVYPCV